MVRNNRKDVKSDDVVGRIDLAGDGNVCGGGGGDWVNISGRFHPHRHHPLWIAFIIHRLSGLALAVFLPLHFYVLGLAIRDAAALDGFLVLTQSKAVKLAEFTLVFLLAVHLFGGLRILALEFLPWSDRQKTLTASATAIAFLVACSFLLQAW